VTPGWFALPFVIVAAVVQLTSGRPEVAFTAGLVAALVNALVVQAMVRPLKLRMESLTNAARVVQAELAMRPEEREEDPVQLARGVNAIAERAREQARQLNTLSSVMDSMVEGLLITDATGRIIRHNDAVKGLLYAGRDLLGRTAMELISSQPLQDAIEEACRRGRPTRLEISVEGLRPRVLEVSVVPLGREVGGSASMFHDVTELRRLEKVRTDFVANVSHELRTPITAIRGYAETLNGGALKDEANAWRMVGIIHRQAERLSELVEDLLEVARLEAKEISLSSQRVPLAETALKAVDAVRFKSDGKGITVEISAGPGDAVLGDPRAVEQVLINLLDNAVKYTPEGGKVTVSARSDPDGLAVEVHDSGVGMDAKHLPRIFERFYRVDKGRSREMGGTGLGLSIVKHLVNAMHGEVKVSSQPGAGTTFTFILPTPPP
jgi:two-component system phosphate regulon sensor histidine kinase PhoR